MRDREPAWQPDPTLRHELRYWDGQRWTDRVSDRGRVDLDPLDGDTGLHGHLLAHRSLTIEKGVAPEPIRVRDGAGRVLASLQATGPGEADLTDVGGDRVLSVRFVSIAGDECVAVTDSVGRPLGDAVVSSGATGWTTLTSADGDMVATLAREPDPSIRCIKNLSSSTIATITTMSDARLVTLRMLEPVHPDLAALLVAAAFGVVNADVKQ